MLLIRILLISFAISSYAIACDSADVWFEVEKGSNKKLTLKAFNRSTTLFSQTVDKTFNSTIVFGQNTLSRHDDGYKIVYRGSDETSLNLEIDEDGNISLSGANEQTGFEKRKSWGFKTPGIIRHQGSSLFYRLFTDAQQFYNYGIIKSYIGKLAQDYLFNGGIIHFGDETAYVDPEAYLEYLSLVYKEAQPSYEKGIIDDRGVILAEKGLSISGLTHRVSGLVDIGGQGLEVHNAGIDNRGTINVVGPIWGHLHHFSNHKSFYADSMQSSNLTINNWSNSGQVYLSQSSELFSQDSWDNTGHVIMTGNSSVGCSKKPTALGVVVSNGEIKAIIKEAFDHAALQEMLGKAAFISGKRKIIVDALQHTDHYLNTITHYKDRYGFHVRTTETGNIFQRRTTEKIKKEIEKEGKEEFSQTAAKVQKIAQEERDFLNTFKKILKEKLKRLGLSKARSNAIKVALFKGLSEAGLSDEDIREIFEDEGITSNLIGLLSSYDQLSYVQKESIKSSVPEVHLFLDNTFNKAEQVSLPIWKWVQENPMEVIDVVCRLANVGSFVHNPWIKLPSSAVAHVCNLAWVVPRIDSTIRAVKNLRQAQAFFNKKHEGGLGKLGKGEGFGTQRTANPPKAKSKGVTKVEGENTIKTDSRQAAERREQIRNMSREELKKIKDLKDIGFKGDGSKKLGCDGPTCKIDSNTESQQSASDIYRKTVREFKSEKDMRGESFTQRFSDKPKRINDKNLAPKIEDTGGKIIKPKNLETAFEDGSRVAIRPEGKSGHPKVEITDAFRNTHEKITIIKK